MTHTKKKQQTMANATEKPNDDWLSFDPLGFDMTCDESDDFDATPLERIRKITTSKAKLIHPYSTRKTIIKTHSTKKPLQTLTTLKAMRPNQ